MPRCVCVVVVCTHAVLCTCCVCQRGAGEGAGCSLTLLSSRARGLAQPCPSQSLLLAGVCPSTRGPTLSSLFAVMSDSLQPHGL